MEFFLLDFESHSNIFFFLLGDVTPFRISVVAIAANQQNPGGFDLTYLQRSCGGAAGAFES